MEDVVARLSSWLETNAPDVANAMAPGASDEEIAAFEKVLGTALPAGMRALYRWHNGGKGALIGNRVLMPLAEITSTRQLMNKAVDDGAFKTTNWYRKTWVPFLSNRAGDHVCWDPRGSFSGSPGQVLEFWHTDHDRKVLAPTFDAWLTALVESIEAGVWRLEATRASPTTTASRSLSEPGSPASPSSRSTAMASAPKRARRRRRTSTPIPTRETKSTRRPIVTPRRHVTHRSFGTGVIQRARTARSTCCSRAACARWSTPRARRAASTNRSRSTTPARPRGASSAACGRRAQPRRAAPHRPRGTARRAARIRARGERLARRRASRVAAPASSIDRRSIACATLASARESSRRRRDPASRERIAPSIDERDLGWDVNGTAWLPRW